MIYSRQPDSFLPGVPPTGRPLEIAMVGVIGFRGDQLFFEYFALAQLGMFAPTGLDPAQLEIGRNVLDPFGQPSNTLLERWSESE
ncbi:hypothetical protein HD554DRAFT_2129389 [Boletus coccyginus]|nr:hypothetical protein HD554DRAFT_2129389 [Boletus coccyginus]